MTPSDHFVDIFVFSFHKPINHIHSITKLSFAPGIVIVVVAYLVAYIRRGFALTSFRSAILWFFKVFTNHLGRNSWFVVFIYLKHC